VLYEEGPKSQKGTLSLLQKGWKTIEHRPLEGSKDGEERLLFFPRRKKAPVGRSEGRGPHRVYLEKRQK